MKPPVALLAWLLAASIVGASTGCAHTVVVETEPAGAVVRVDGQLKGESPVIMQQRTSTGGRLHLEVSAEGYETKNVVVTQSDWFLWPILVAIVPGLMIPVVVVPVIGPFITVGWAVITSPTLLALAFMQKYPDRVKVTLRPRMGAGVLQPTDGWLIPDDYDPNPPPLPDEPPPPPPPKRPPPQPEGANPVP
jgi:hypothetical protein